MTYTVFSAGYFLIFRLSRTHRQTPLYSLASHVLVLCVSVGVLFWKIFKQRHDVSLLMAFLLSLIVSTLPIPKIYRAIKARASTSATSVGESVQSLQGGAVSSELFTVRQSASYFSNDDIELVYGGPLAEGNSLPSNSIDGREDEEAILPPLESSIETQTGDARISVAGQDPGVTDEQQGDEPRQ